MFNLTSFLFLLNRHGQLKTFTLPQYVFPFRKRNPPFYADKILHLNLERMKYNLQTTKWNIAIKCVLSPYHCHCHNGVEYLHVYLDLHLLYHIHVLYYCQIRLNNSQTEILNITLLIWSDECIFLLFGSAYGKKSSCLCSCQITLGYCCTSSFWWDRLVSDIFAINCLTFSKLNLLPFFHPIFILTKLAHCPSADLLLALPVLKELA